jgi:tetratricopeptide (TPR) repeat protein
MKQVSYRRHRFPGSIIQHAVWLYFRFPLSYRDIEDLLSERGIDVTYETIRRWALKFGSADPNDAAAYLNRGNVYYVMGDNDRAIADFGMAITLDAKNADAYMNRGLALAREDEVDRATGHFRKALEIDPSNQKAEEGLKRLGILKSVSLPGL